MVVDIVQTCIRCGSSYRSCVVGRCPNCEHQKMIKQTVKGTETDPQRTVGTVHPGPQAQQEQPEATELDASPSSSQEGTAGQDWDNQVDGAHYRKAKGGEQHWDRQWRLRGRAWFIGNITKYVERYDSKDGFLDLDKALHYLNKLIALERAATDGTGPLPGGRDNPLPKTEE